MPIGSSIIIVNAQEDDECMFGPGGLKEIIDTMPNPDPTFIEMYNDAVRQEEIKEYIDDNIDDLNVPDWMQDSNIIICGITNDVQERERRN